MWSFLSKLFGIISGICICIWAVASSIIVANCPPNRGPVPISVIDGLYCVNILNFIVFASCFPLLICSLIGLGFERWRGRAQSGVK